MKKKTALIIFSLLVITSSAFGFTIDATGFPVPSGVEGIKIELSVSAGFSLLSSVAGGAIPATLPLSFPWVTTTPSLVGNLLTLDWYNGDLFDLTPIPGVSDGVYTQNNMLNGTIATLNISSGTILGINSFLFSDFGGSPVAYSNLISANIQPNGVTFNAVPLPAAVWLLGSGLVGLVVLKRRKKA
jgi:hypothetical protein